MVKVKSAEEMRKRLRDLVNRHRKSYIKSHMDYNPSRCGIIGLGLHPECRGCNVARGCKNHKCFDLLDGLDELNEQFAQEIKDPAKLVREYRDVAVLLWCLGTLSDNQEERGRLLDAALTTTTPQATFSYSVIMDRTTMSDRHQSYWHRIKDRFLS